MNSDTVFAALNVKDPILIGEGQESVVYDIQDGRVVKILKNADFTQLANEQCVYERLAKAHTTFRFPHILEYGTIAGTDYLLEEKLPGVPLSNTLEQTTDSETRRILLHNVLVATKTLRDITFPELPYGDLISLSPLHNARWVDYFTAKVHEVFAKHHLELTKHSPYGNDTLAQYLAHAEALLSNKQTPPSFVHGDLWPPNILIEGTDVTAIIDLNDKSLIGDSFIDLASLKTFSDKWLTIDEQHCVENEISHLFGDDVTRVLNLYIVYYAFLFAGVKDSDPKAYDWAIGIIQNIDTYLQPRHRVI